QPGAGCPTKLGVGSPSQLVVTNRGKDGQWWEVGEREARILPGRAGMKGQDNRGPGDEDPKNPNPLLAQDRPDTWHDQGGQERAEEPPRGGRERVVQPRRKVVRKPSVAGGERRAQRVQRAPRINLQITGEWRVATLDEADDGRDNSWRQHY